MKKVFGFALMLCVIVFGICAETAVIREVTGEVELKQANASAFVPARPGSVVANDTIVSTGFKSTAVIEVGDSVIIVRPLTRLSFSEIKSLSGVENVSMNLQSGRIRVDVNPPAGAKSNFTVQSPSSTASVRGTTFDFDTRRVKVNEGKVSFRGSRGIPIPVQAGGESYVGNGNKAVDPSKHAETSLQPPPPVGTESGSGTTAVTESGEIIIDLNFVD